MSINNVALVSLPPMDLIRPPAALAILAAACEEQDIDYNVYDFNLWLYKNTNADVWHKINDNWNAINPFDNQKQEYYKIFQSKLKQYVDIILDSNPELIAISVFYDPCSYAAVELIQLLNQHPLRSNFKIVIGGTGVKAHLALFKQDPLCSALLANGSIDYFIFGEGEITFRKLLTGQLPYAGINNFDNIQIVDLDQFPFPSYKKIHPNTYKYLSSPGIVITASRGCVRKCTYCDVAKYWPKYRYRTGKIVADELYHYYKTLGIQEFEFSDSLINGSLKNFKEMNQAILNYQQMDPNFKISYKGQYICRPQQYMKEQDYKTMKQAGCDYLYVGVESFSDQVRYDMLKKFTNTDLDFHLKMCGKYGIKNSFLMFVGYPTETLSDHQQNLAALKKYQHYAQAGVIAMITFGHTTAIMEDTPLYHMQDQLSIVPEYNFDEGLSYTQNWISLTNPDLTLVERIRRWVELVSLASELGYRMPRINQNLTRFINLLSQVKNKKIVYEINPI